MPFNNKLELTAAVRLILFTSQRIGIYEKVIRLLSSEIEVISVLTFLNSVVFFSHKETHHLPAESVCTEKKSGLMCHRPSSSGGMAVS